MLRSISQEAIINTDLSCFEGYYERLITGQLDFKWEPNGDYQRTAMSQATSEGTTPESMSLPQSARSSLVCSIILISNS